MNNEQIDELNRLAITPGPGFAAAATPQTIVALLDEIVRLRLLAARYLVTQGHWDDEGGDYFYRCRSCSSSGVGWENVAHEDWCVLNKDYTVVK